MHKLAHYPKLLSFCQDVIFLLQLWHTNYRKDGVLNLEMCLMHYSQYNPHIKFLIYTEILPVI